ncbi:MAG: hypothetical protein IJ808_03435 [Muribaculaceae bacterium]|nr:hypothetical protein [Muribaculaceae bacterium]
MKKVILILLLFAATIANAQKDVTKFLGIPVTGTKTAMIQKLKAKGFRYNSTGDYLSGEFNGGKVRVHVVTDNNKVSRIMVEDAYASREGEIKIRFNQLCDQFEKNAKYMSATMSPTGNRIPNSENISYEMLVNGKRYESAYYQLPEVIDTVAVEKARRLLLTKHKDEISNATKEQQMEWGIEALGAMVKKKSVWFMINEYLGEYRILMYYDNEYNRPNGEDL